MAYFIFLKSLRSLEEFRKNPHVKIPPKSSCANFQSLAIFKNLIFIQKGIFFGFRPIRPSPAPRWPIGRRLPAQPTQPKPRWHIFRKAYSLRPCALRQRCLLSLTSPPCGACLLAPSPSSRQPTIVVSPHRLRPPRATQLHPRMSPEPLLAPPSFPPPPLIPS
jgi:hypothetical protein